MVDSHVSVPKPFASGDATEWFKRFDICSTANNWNNATKALKLPTLLEGEALAIWLELGEREHSDYGTARSRILEAMTPMGFVYPRRLPQPQAAPLGSTICLCARAQEVVGSSHARPRRRRTRLAAVALISPRNPHCRKPPAASYRRNENARGRRRASPSTPGT